MPDNDHNINENEFEEIDLDDLDPLPVENEDIEESEHATADVPPFAGLMDMIADQNAADARAEIYRALYNKVGERIEGIKSEIRKSV